MGVQGLPVSGAQALLLLLGLRLPGWRQLLCVSPVALRGVFKTFTVSEVNRGVFSPFEKAVFIGWK